MSPVMFAILMSGLFLLGSGITERAAYRLVFTILSIGWLLLGLKG
jgi:hypothetical protein